VNFVAFEMFANAIRPGQQIQNVGGRFQVEKPRCLFARNLTAMQHAPAQSRDCFVIARVNNACGHG
jgi:hypothetical protein